MRLHPVSRVAGFSGRIRGSSRQLMHRRRSYLDQCHKASHGRVDRTTNNWSVSGGAITLFLATYFGIPVSTTHTITGAIVGVGAARKTAAVRWNVASGVVLAWIVTLPAAGAAFYELYKLLS
jgi:hypothetical protein